MIKEIEVDQDTVQKLRESFDKHSDKRILVLGTTCAGKSTLIKSLPECVDQDEVCWALLPKEYEEKLSKGSWTQEMIEYWNKHVENATQIMGIEIGHPLFGGTMFKSDIIIYLNINDDTLRERTKKRGMAYEMAVNYNEKIKEQLKITDLPVIVIDI
jgi:deoxyadenosine/deoxycytidine kinase